MIYFGNFYFFLFNINLVFLFYYVWGFFFFIVLFFKNFINYIYFKFNNNIITFKKDFNDLGYFEKLFLILFSKNGEFKNSIGNIYSNNNLFNHRKSKYPLIFFFHLYSQKMDYKFFNLFFLNKFFNFFKNSKRYYSVLNRIKFIFFKKLYNDNIMYKDYLVFLILQKISYKRYYNLCSSIYFKNFNINNLVKLNWMFYLFLINSEKRCVIYDLSKYTDWYNFNFKKNQKIVFKKTIKTKYKNNLYKKYADLNLNYLETIYKKYNVFYKKISKKLNYHYKSVFLLNFKYLSISKNKFFFNNIWFDKLKIFYPIRFSDSSIVKYIEFKKLNNYLFFYIRKNRIFNKGRYSRNRQLYRTGVYWCLWLNIILVYGLYFLFYRFTFNFGYFWWGLLIFFYSTIFSRAIKYNFHNIYKIYLEFYNFINWLGFIIISFKKSLLDYLRWNKKYFINNIILIKNVNKLINFYKINNKNKFIYFWESSVHEDTSFLKYKTILNWFKQLYRSLTY